MSKPKHKVRSSEASKNAPTTQRQDTDKKPLPTKTDLPQQTIVAPNEERPQNEPQVKGEETELVERMCCNPFQSAADSDEEEHEMNSADKQEDTANSMLKALHLERQKRLEEAGTAQSQPSATSKKKSKKKKKKTKPPKDPKVEFDRAMNDDDILDQLIVSRLAVPCSQDARQV